MISRLISIINLTEAERNTHMLIFYPLSLSSLWYYSYHLLSLVFLSPRFLSLLLYIALFWYLPISANLTSLSLPFQPQLLLYSISVYDPTIFFLFILGPLKVRLFFSIYICLNIFFHPCIGTVLDLNNLMWLRLSYIY